jgi:uncharacterized protein (UPF0333 family)
MLALYFSSGTSKMKIRFDENILALIIVILVSGIMLFPVKEMLETNLASSYQTAENHKEASKTFKRGTLEETEERLEFILYQSGEIHELLAEQHELYIDMLIGLIELLLVAALIIAFSIFSRWRKIKKYNKTSQDDA